MKAKTLLLTAAAALLLAGCQSDPKPETAPAAEKAGKAAAATAPAAAPTPAEVKAEAAGKAASGEKKSSALDALLGGGKRPSIVDTDSFNSTEREIIRAQERERARDAQKLGPGVYDKESKARKDWVF